MYECKYMNVIRLSTVSTYHKSNQKELFIGNIYAAKTNIYILKDMH